MKFCIFGDFNIRSQVNCLIYGKSEGYIVFRISFRSRIYRKFQHVLKKILFCWPVLFKEDYTNHLAHGGVAIINHKTIPYQKWIFKTHLQAIAANINIGRDVAIVSIYNSRSHDISEKLLSAFFQQLPKRIILTWNLNSYHHIWRNPANDNRGCQFLNFINKNQLNILNDGRHTRPSSISKSAIDLTITSNSSWNVTDSPLSSDHCVITVSVQSENLEP